MALTRRRLLELGTMGVPAAALASRSDVGTDPRVDEKASLAREAGTQDTTGVLLLLEGLIVYVLSAHTGGPQKAAALLMDPSSITLNKAGTSKRLPRHTSTLSIPRVAILNTSTAVPAAVDVERAHFSLFDTVVTFDVREQETPGSRLETGLLFTASMSPRVNNPCNTTKWNSMQWVMDIPTDLAPGATIDPNWRNSGFVQGRVELEFGDLEDPNLPIGIEGNNIEPRRWRVPRVTGTPIKGFKELVRHRFAGGNKFLHINLTNRTSGHSSTIVMTLNNPLNDDKIYIRQLPVHGSHGTDNLDDIVSYLGLLSDPAILQSCLDASCVPTRVTSDSCGGVVKGCDCCGGARIVDPNWK